MRRPFKAQHEKETTMTTNQTRETATIYQFPVGGRAGLGGRRDVLERTAPPANEVVISGNWYHEEAIRDADLTRKH
jgi:hypothetical protein